MVGGTSLTAMERGNLVVTNEYQFNGDGARVQIVDSQGTKKPIWDFENILLETDGSNVTQCEVDPIGSAPNRVEYF
jgi:hypothetical protein